MKKVLVGSFLGFLLVFLASYSSYAEMCGCMGEMEKGMHGGGMPMMHGPQHRGMEMRGAEHRIWGHLKNLGLDEQQKTAIREIVSGTMKDTIRKRADIRIARIELHDILGKDPVDMGAVEGKLKQIGAMQTDLRLSHIKAREEIKAKLTPEQRKKFNESFREHGKWMQEGMGKIRTCEKKEKKKSAK